MIKVIIMSLIAYCSHFYIWYEAIISLTLLELFRIYGIKTTSKKSHVVKLNKIKI